MYINQSILVEGSKKNVKPFIRLYAIKKENE